MPAQPRKRPTIRDVARLSGVSISTVSLVFNSPKAVAPTTRERVEKAVQELGYRPNATARSLNLNRVGSIGLMVPDLSNPYFVNIIAGVEWEARQRGNLLVVGATDWQTSAEEQYSGLLTTRRLDGVIVASGSGLPPTALVQMASSEPVVFVDERVAGFDGHFVGVDNRRAAREAAAYVFGLGHRRVGIIGGPLGLWTAEQRLAGYREAAVAAGIDADLIPVVHGDYRVESGEEAARRLLEQPDARPTALLIANDMMAMGAIAYCRGAGLAIPRDVGVVGFDDIPAASLISPPLTTVRQPGRELGIAAARLLLDRVDGREGERQVTLPADLIIRDSVRPPKGGV